MLMVLDTYLLSDIAQQGQIAVLTPEKKNKEKNKPVANYAQPHNT